MQRHGGMQGRAHVTLPVYSSVHLKHGTPTVCQGLPMPRVCCLSLVSGPHQTDSPGSSAGAPWSREGLCSQATHWAFAASPKQQCSVMPSIIVPFWPLPTPRRMASKFLSQLVSNNIQMVLPQAQQPSLSRTTGAKTKVGPGTLFCCLSKSRGLWTSVSFTLRK